MTSIFTSNSALVLGTQPNDDMTEAQNPKFDDDVQDVVVPAEKCLRNYSLHERYDSEKIKATTITAFERWVYFRERLAENHFGGRYPFIGDFWSLICEGPVSLNGKEESAPIKLSDNDKLFLLAHEEAFLLGISKTKATREKNEPIIDKVLAASDDLVDKMMRRRRVAFGRNQDDVRSVATSRKQSPEPAEPVGSKRARDQEDSSLAF